jgi:hypothetical protein
VGKAHKGLMWDTSSITVRSGCLDRACKSCCIGGGDEEGADIEVRFSASGFGSPMLSPIALVDEESHGSVGRDEQTIKS